MNTHVIFGAGPVGRALAAQLSAAGTETVLVSRSGRSVDLPHVRSIAALAQDADAVHAAAVGATAIYNCLNPEYTKWTSDWPPMATNLLAAARSNEARYVICSNMYMYAPQDRAIRVDDPTTDTGSKGVVRERMWQDALAAHRRGEMMVAEVRSSDYVGAGTQSHLGERVVPRVLAGKSVRVLGSPDAIHSWTYADDVATTMRTVAMTDSAMGRVWHTPTNDPLTQRQVIDELADLAGADRVRVSAIPRTMVTALGMVSPLIRELKETYHQFAEPFVIDDSITRTELGLEPTPWDDVLRNHLSEWTPTIAAGHKMPA